MEATLSVKTAEVAMLAEQTADGLAVGTWC